jgi:AcrR family transcriptional regulator
MGRTSSRDLLIEAAARVAREQGVLGLSVDRVLEAAGLSKGGFFYHFRTKDELVEAVVGYELDRFESLVQMHAAAGSTFSEALVTALLEFVQTDSTMMGSVNAALAFGGPVRQVTMERRARWEEALRREHDDPVRAQLLALAVDGLIFSCSYRDGAPSPREVTQWRNALMRLAKGGAP